MKPQFNLSLKKCESLQQIFDLCKEYYCTEQQLGIITGHMVKKKIPELIKDLKIKERQ